jgi:hypothetical protein
MGDPEFPAWKRRASIGPSTHSPEIQLRLLWYHPNEGGGSSRGGSMRYPSLSTNPKTLWLKYGIYHLARLQYDPELSRLAAFFGPAQEGLHSLVDATREARLEAIGTQAIRDQRYDVMARNVRGFSRALLKLVAGDTRSRLYRRFFPNGATGLLSGTIEERLRKVEALLARLIREPLPGLGMYEEILRGATEALGSALNSYYVAAALLDQSRSALMVQKLVWFDAYKRSYEELTRMFPGEPWKVDDFFHQPGKGHKEES